MFQQQQTPLPSGPPTPVAAASSVAPLGQFRPIVNATAVTAAVAVPQSIVTTAIPAVTNLTAQAQIAATGLPHQWDPSMASFYNFPLAGIY
ncbi:hypothetical protein BLA29_015045 [Euroglyphus maynei]|uniref:Uncharacterized protein n=1 Tax=Euroglyphus maynei TaxID=6958 RepID=A0A1Y3BA76_EURMA|nr:hypothetical protein BLA29_015045 [Euroglyphus maynei]